MLEVETAEMQDLIDKGKLASILARLSLYKQNRAY